MRANQENMQCVFEGYKYRGIILIIYIILLIALIFANIQIYNKLVAKAKDRFSQYEKIIADKNLKLMSAIESNTPDVG